MKKTRSQLFRELNVKPKNPQWAWCAKSDSLKRAVFTLWEDEELPGNKWLLHDPDFDYKKPGYFDQKKVLDIAATNNFETLGIICIAVDIKARPRSIKEVKGDYIYKIKLLAKENKIYGVKQKVIPLLDLFRSDNKKFQTDGLNDLFLNELGSDIPDRSIKTGIVIKRNRKVREAVLKRANGKCEYCGNKPFGLKNGDIYLETHHIINLANQGPDKVNNVIALCPNHHREAHFGKNAEELEEKFLEIILNKN